MAPIREAELGDPTAFPDLNLVLRELVASIRSVLVENFCGAYLQGSFAVGDADAYSDVDFVIVTNDEVSDQQLAALQAMHDRLFNLDSSWAQHLEGSYISKKSLRRLDPARPPYLYLDNGSNDLEWDNHCNTELVRWSLREHGVILAGPDPTSLIDPVSSDQLRQDTRIAMDEWAPWAKSAPMSRWKQPYVVLTGCRMLHTLLTGAGTTKREAGEWARGALDDSWAGLIQRALDDRPNPWQRVHQPAEPRATESTAAFVEYVVEQGVTGRDADGHPYTSLRD